MDARAGASDDSANEAGAGSSAPLVSVIIPFLDPPELFLREAVESVLAQDYRPIELILVNDGSSAATLRMVERLVEDIAPPVRCIEHPGGINLGLSATRNAGVAESRGDFIAFLDADDAWLPGKLAEQVGILQDDADLALVFGPTMYWHSWNTSAHDPQEDRIVTGGLERDHTLRPPKFVARFLRGRIVNPSASNFMVRRDAYLACGGFEESFRGMYEDQAFMIKLGLGHSVRAVSVCWDRYRQHPQSMTAQADAAGAEESARRVFLTWVRRYCTEHDISAPEVWEAINKEAWLSGASATRKGAHFRSVRWLKKWWLRLEELLLPSGLQQRRWGSP